MVIICILIIGFRRKVRKFSREIISQQGSYRRLSTSRHTCHNKNATMTGGNAFAHLFTNSIHAFPRKLLEQKIQLNSVHIFSNFKYFIRWDLLLVGTEGQLRVNNVGVRYCSSNSRCESLRWYKGVEWGDVDIDAEPRCVQTHLQFSAVSTPSHFPKLTMIHLILILLLLSTEPLISVRGVSMVPNAPMSSLKLSAFIIDTISKAGGTSNIIILKSPVVSQINLQSIDRVADIVGESLLDQPRNGDSDKAVRVSFVEHQRRKCRDLLANGQWLPLISRSK